VPGKPNQRGGDRNPLNALGREKASFLATGNANTVVRRDNSAVSDKLQLSPLPETAKDCRTSKAETRIRFPVRTYFSMTSLTTKKQSAEARTLDTDVPWKLEDSPNASVG